MSLDQGVQKRTERCNVKMKAAHGFQSCNFKKKKTDFEIILQPVLKYFFYDWGDFEVESFEETNRHVRESNCQDSSTSHRAAKKYGPVAHRQINSQDFQ